jgi:hypothetical protein
MSVDESITPAYPDLLLRIDPPFQTCHN